MNNQTIFLHTLICLIELNEISHKELIYWCDQYIESDNQPEYLYIQLSLSHNHEEAQSIIRQYLYDHNVLNHIYLDTLSIGLFYLILVKQKIDFKEFSDRMKHQLFEHASFEFSEDHLGVYFNDDDIYLFKGTSAEAKCVEYLALTKPALQVLLKQNMKLSHFE